MGGLSERSDVTKGRVLCLTGAKATRFLAGDKTLKPRSASLWQRRRLQPAIRQTHSYFRDNSAIPPPVPMRGRACDLDVELGLPSDVKVWGNGLSSAQALRDLSSNRRKPGWLQPLT